MRKSRMTIFAYNLRLIVSLWQMLLLILLLQKIIVLPVSFFNLLFLCSKRH